MTREEVERLIHQVLDEYARAPAGAPGLRTLGTGANQAAPGTKGTTVTTKGDLQGYSTGPVRVPVGDPGEVLTADPSASLGVSWQASYARSLLLMGG